MSRKIKVIQPPDDKVPAEVIATAILEIATAFKVLSKSRLKQYTIVALIHDRSKISKGVIEIVLNNLENLEKNWLK